MALSAFSATQITDLLTYNFGGPGSALYPRHLEKNSGRPSCQPGHIHHQESHVKQTANILGTFTAAFVKVCIVTGSFPQAFQSLLALHFVCMDIKSCHLWMLKWASVILALSLMCTPKLQVLIKICCHIEAYTALCKSTGSRCLWQIAVQECMMCETQTQEPPVLFFNNRFFIRSFHWDWYPV